MDEFKVEHYTKDVYLGYGGQEFSTKEGALESLIKGEIHELLYKSGDKGSHFDIDSAVNEILFRGSDLIRWLRLMGKE